MNNKIPFLITIDTEGDNLWSTPMEVTTYNARNLHRFQLICNEYGFKPTYLTNYEMATGSVPLAPRWRMPRRRAWKVVQFEVEVTSM